MELNRNDYRRRAGGCWMGKNIGGTLGAPFEFIRQVNDVSSYTQDLGGEPLPNDDLDLQLLWLIAMEQRGLDVDAHRLAEYWCLYITPHWSEYGIAKTNLRAGLLPPHSGMRGNEWRHSCGAFIRSEIWACVAPGLPDVAARYAAEDAIVDHGDGEGTWGEVFFAALESAAFVCDDLTTLIDIGLSYIPADCGMAAAIRCAVDAHKSGMGWRKARLEILGKHRGATLFGIPERTSADDRALGLDTGQLGYDAPCNVALTVLALLEGGDDFAKTVCTAVNCGEDTDCTGATAGALFGLIHGIEAIPDEWIEPIGRSIKTLTLDLGDLGGQVPQTIDELTERSERMAGRVLARDRRNTLTDSPAAAKKPSVDALRASDALRADLAVRVGVCRHRFDFFTVDVQPADGPTIRTGEPKPVKVTIRNTGGIQAALKVQWHTPAGWRVRPAAAGAALSLPKLLGGPVELDFTLHPGPLTIATARCVIEITAEGRPTAMTVPVAFANANLQPT